MIITLFVYASVGFKQIKSEEEEEQAKVLKRQGSNLHPDDKISRKTEIICIAFSQHNNSDQY